MALAEVGWLLLTNLQACRTRTRSAQRLWLANKRAATCS
jgi:hypothetical protein